jgi:hypothetical protein
MNKRLHKIELFIDRIIPYTVIALTIIIILELFFYGRVERYSIYIRVVDYAVISIFCIDLVFKYLKVRRIPLFIRRYWIDILVVFPFFLLFRIFEEIYALAAVSSFFRSSQAVIHEGIIIEKEGVMLVRAAERTQRLSRTHLFIRFVRPLLRIPRLAKIIPYFERPTEEHHAVIKEIITKNRKKLK